MKRILSIRLPYLYLLAISAALVSFIGATFSVTGLAKLFSGAPLAVMFMAGSLEFAKVVSAGFLHQNWERLGWGLRGFLSSAVLVLIMITSFGIFGYLSHAYQKASVTLNSTQIQLDALNKENAMIEGEIARIQKTLDEVPPNRVSKRVELQREAEPEIQRLKKRSFDLNIAIQKTLVERQGLQTEIGPLVYLAEAAGFKMDQVARWFIFMFVCVFDPLAICLVFATSWALKNQARKEQEEAERAAVAATTPASSPDVVPNVASTPENATAAGDNVTALPVSNAS